MKYYSFEIAMIPLIMFALSVVGAFFFDTIGNDLMTLICMGVFTTNVVMTMFVSMILTEKKLNARVVLTKSAELNSWFKAIVKTVEFGRFKRDFGVVRYSLAIMISSRVYGIHIETKQQP